MSDDKVVILPVVTRLDIPPERILKGALRAELRQAIVVGYDAEGEFYFASSIADGAEAVWLFELAKLELLQISRKKP